MSSHTTRGVQVGQFAETRLQVSSDSPIRSKQSLISLPQHTLFQRSSAGRFSPAFSHLNIEGK